MTTPRPLLDAAHTAHTAGLCVIPASTNGLKQPWPDSPAWKAYETARPTLEQLDAWFGSGRYDGFGYVCGAISGNLELLELEGRAVAEGYLARYATLLAEHGLAELWDRITAGYLEMTPSGGIHILLRVDGQVHRNTKLAQRPAREDELTDDEREILTRKPHKVFSRVLVETRGEGGFTVAAPSAGRTHPTGAPWVLARGSVQTIAAVSEDERDALHAIATMLDSMPAAAAPAPPAPAPGGNRTADHSDGVLRPGDDYNLKASWREILEPHGWRHTRNFGQALGWTRPGKSIGISATTGTNDGDNLYVFSSSTEFETETPYSKFAAYTLLEHGNDFSRATSALRAQGYGGPLPERDDAAELYALIAPPAPGTQGPPPFGVDGALATVHHLPGAEQTAPEPVTAEQAAANAFEREVEHELRKLKIREEAARRARRARVGIQGRPAITPLDEFLAVPDEPAQYRVDGLWPVGGRAILAAQFKAGKTTMVGNIMRSLVDSVPFLGQFAVQPFAGRVVLLDDELDERMVRRWLRDQGIENLPAAAVVSLRGRLSSFDILDPAVRSEWAADLRAAGAAVVVLDCLAPILDALGLSEDKEAGRFLVAFDEMLKEAGVSEAIVVHHMGHSGERSRGASRLRDWPDVEWRLVREKSEDGEMDPAAPRYFSAYGRDVDVPESLLSYDATSRRLELSGGSRRDTKTDRVLEAIVEYLTLTPGATGRDVERALKESEHGREDLRKALKRGANEGVLRTAPGPGGGHRYYVLDASKVARSAPPILKRDDFSDLVNNVSAAQVGAPSAPTMIASIEVFNDISSTTAPDARRTETPGHNVSAPSAPECASAAAVSAPVRPPTGEARTGALLAAPEPDPAHSRSKYGDLGTCQACGQEMVILAPEQTHHPMCPNTPTPAEATL
ncbi:AAA family ATPase [Streptosporangium sp. G12]